jgi:hypothetical protein
MAFGFGCFLHVLNPNPQSLFLKPRSAKFELQVQKSSGSITPTGSKTHVKRGSIRFRIFRAYDYRRIHVIFEENEDVLSKQG